MTLFEAAAEIAAFLEERSIEYVILGGLAVQHWGEPRATHDVDVTVMVPQERLEKFAQEILQRFRPRLPDALGFALRHRVLLVESASGVPIDISLGIPGYEEEVMRRAVRVHFPTGVLLRFISAEDLIIHKCVAGRARDQEDIERILIRQKLQLDLEYIRRWLQDFAPLVSTHSVRAVFEEALHKAHQALREDHPP
ncbi:MAG: nucleotidyltransferase [Candidatus Bipolaricaulota bacterium]|nr:nucleotidyltransferase [Candidatus Bipolaricaulota bacterium]